MGLVHVMLFAVVYLVGQGLELVGFFLMVRLITIHWRFRPLLAFDRIGQPVVEPLLGAAQRAIPTEWVSQEPQRIRLAAAATLLAVTLCRCALGGVAHILILPL